MKSFSSFKSNIVSSLPAPELQENYKEPAEPQDQPSKDIIDSNGFLMPSDLSRPVWVMCPPFSLDTSQPNNVWMKELAPKDRKINKLKAVEQFFSVYGYVSNVGIIYLLPSKKGLGDLPYVANLGINLPHLPNDNTIVLANFKSEPREDETIVGQEFFENLGYATAIAPQYFEGEADLKFINKNNYIGAYGMRTNMNALNWFSKTYDMNIIPVHIDDEKMYHLDCLIFPVEADSTLVVTSLLDKKTLKAIEKITDVIDVPEDCYGLTNSVRAGNMILNGTRLPELKKTDDDYYEELKKNTTLEKLVVKLGYEVIFFNISEFSKSGADLSCMFMHLNYPNLATGEE